MAIHCLSNDNNNMVIGDSVYLYFFELPSDSEGILLKSFKYGAVQSVLSMAMSKKDMVRRSSKKKAMLEELEKQAASGSGDAKKKLAKAKKKMK